MACGKHTKISKLTQIKHKAHAYTYTVNTYFQYHISRCIRLRWKNVIDSTEILVEIETHA